MSRLECVQTDTMQHSFTLDCWLACTCPASSLHLSVQELESES